MQSPSSLPSLSRRRLLASGTTTAAGVGLGAGVTELVAGQSPTFAASDPAPGTWPIPRYGPRNTGHNPNAAIPRAEPSVAWRSPVATDVESLVVAGGVVAVGTYLGPDGPARSRTVPSWRSMRRPATRSGVAPSTATPTGS